MRQLKRDFDHNSKSTSKKSYKERNFNSNISNGKDGSEKKKRLEKNFSRKLSSKENK